MLIRKPDANIFRLATSVPIASRFIEGIKEALIFSTPPVSPLAAYERGSKEES